MSVSTPTLITFLIYIAAMILIGFIAYRATKNFSDYILGGRSLGSFVTALSAGLGHERLAADGPARRDLRRWSVGKLDRHRPDRRPGSTGSSSPGVCVCTPSTTTTR